MLISVHACALLQNLIKFTLSQDAQVLCNVCELLYRVSIERDYTVGSLQLGIGDLVNIPYNGFI